MSGVVGEGGGEGEDELRASFLANGRSYLSFGVGFTLPVKVLDILREAREIGNDKLVPECSRYEDHICLDHAGKG